jgi:hypothetical protein
MHERSICWEAISHLLPQYACGARIEGTDRGEEGYRRGGRGGGVEGELWQKKGTGRKVTKEREGGIVLFKWFKGLMSWDIFYHRFSFKKV